MNNTIKIALGVVAALWLLGRCSGCDSSVTYSGRDERDIDFTFELTDDEKVVFTCSRDGETEINYGTWWEYKDIIRISINDGIPLHTTYKDCTYWGEYFIKDDYLYVSLNDAEAEHPGRRLKMH